MPPSSYSAKTIRDYPANDFQDCPANGNLQFVIGQDLQGHWIVAEPRRRSGGIFVSKEAALQYAASEWGLRPEMMRWSNEPVALWN